MLKFEWDKKKNQSNIDKHRISFDTAKEVFEDENRIQYFFGSSKYGERGWKTVGQILGIAIKVVYTVRKRIFRIISARRASRNEKQDYLNHNT